RTNHDSRCGYWYPLKRLRRCQKRVGRPEPWCPCEAFPFSLLRALSSKEIVSGRCLFPLPANNSKSRVSKPSNCGGLNANTVSGTYRASTVPVPGDTDHD